MGCVRPCTHRGSLRGTAQTLPLINYLNAASFVPLYAIGRLVGVWHGISDFRAQYFSDRTPFVFAGRFVAACLGALSAPLAVLIARRLGLNRRSSLIVGGMVALFPINIWMSHVAKPDIGVASAVLLLAWSLLHKLDKPEAKGADIVPGVSLALAVSFKQTALLVVAPALIGLVVLLKWDRGLTWPKITRGLTVSLVACVLAWIPMNIGVLLDIEGFLDWQRLTLIAVQSGSPASAPQFAEVVVRTLSGNVMGMTAAGLIVWLIAPFVRRDWKFLVLWGSSAFAYVAINVASGPEIIPRYYLPYHELAFTLGCVAALSLVEREGPSKPVGFFLAVAVLACSAVGSVEIVRQAMTIPMGVRCSEVIKAIANPEQDKILAAALYLLGLPINEAAVREERERQERLAKKYGVKIREKPKERMSSQDGTSRSYYARQIPYELGGERSRESSLSGRMKKILPYWWPIQCEEWDLDYWTTRGFDIFVLVQGAGFTGAGHHLFDEPLYRSFHEQIKERSDLVATLRTTRTLFGEQEVEIYRLRRP